MSARDEGYIARINCETSEPRALGKTSLPAAGFREKDNCAILSRSKSTGRRRVQSPRFVVTGGITMRARVLVVDDDEGYLAGIKELLEGAGYEMLVANSFEEGK